MESGQTASLKKNRVKKALDVACYWPPSGGQGAQRWLKFSPLRANGWQPTLLVPDGAAYPVLGETSTEDVPDHLKVFTVPNLDPYLDAMAQRNNH